MNVFLGENERKKIIKRIDGRRKVGMNASNKSDGESLKLQKVETQNTASISPRRSNRLKCPGKYKTKHVVSFV